MSLRSRCIEAGARAVDPFMVHPLETEDAAEAVLDAILSCLTENADEWADYPENTDPIVVAHREIIARKLLAVLRNPE